MAHLPRDRPPVDTSTMKGMKNMIDEMRPTVNTRMSDSEVTDNVREAERIMRKPAPR